jgi:hypothetical protein
LSSWDPAAGHLGICYFHPFLVRFPRPISLHQERQMTTATQNPGEVLEIRIKQKNPSDATSKTIQPRASNITKTSAPASTLFLLARFRFILPVAAEGRLQVTSPIHKRDSNSAANFQCSQCIDSSGQGCSMLTVV